MRRCRLFISALPFGLWMLLLFAAPSAKSQPPAAGETSRPRILPAKGVVVSINRDEQQLVVRHEAISNYMDSVKLLHAGSYEKLDWLGKIRYHLFVRLDIYLPERWSFLDPSVGG